MKFLLLVLYCMMGSPVLASEGGILVLGDSISASYGLESQALGWVSLLQQKLKAEGFAIEVTNASIAGETTEGGLARLDALLLQKKPAIVIVELGTNDQVRWIQPETMKSNLQSILLKSKHAKVLLLGATVPADTLKAPAEQFAKVYEDLALQPNVSLAPNFLSGISDNPRLMLPGDRIHPNAEAQALLLQAVWPKLSRLLNGH